MNVHFSLGTADVARHPICRGRIPPPIGIIESATLQRSMHVSLLDDRGLREDIPVSADVLSVDWSSCDTAQRLAQ